MTGHGKAVADPARRRATRRHVRDDELGDTSRSRPHRPVPEADRGARVVALQIGLRPADAQALAHAGIEGGLTIVARGAVRPRRAPRRRRAGHRPSSDWIARGTAARPDERPRRPLRPRRPHRRPRPAGPPVDRAPLPGGRKRRRRRRRRPEADGSIWPFRPGGPSHARVVAVGDAVPHTPPPGASSSPTRRRSRSPMERRPRPATADAATRSGSGRRRTPSARPRAALRRPPFADLAVVFAGLPPLPHRVPPAGARHPGRPRGRRDPLGRAGRRRARADRRRRPGRRAPAPGRPRGDGRPAEHAARPPGGAGGRARRGGGRRRHRAGAALSAAVVDVVQLGAGTSAAVPPLRAAVPAGAVAAALLAFAVVALAPVAALAGRRTR